MSTIAAVEHNQFPPGLCIVVSCLESTQTCPDDSPVVGGHVPTLVCQDQRRPLPYLSPQAGVRLGQPTHAQGEGSFQSLPPACATAETFKEEGICLGQADGADCQSVEEEVKPTGSVGISKFGHLIGTDWLS